MSNTPSNVRRRKRLRELYAKGKTIHFVEQGAVIYSAKGDLLQAIGVDLQDVDLDQFRAEPWPHGDGGEDAIVVHCTPPNPLQREEALREGQAARARMVLRVIKEPDSPEGLNARTHVAEMGEDELLDYLQAMHEGDYQQQAQRNVLSGEDWKDFTALQDSLRRWDELQRPDTEEWRPVLDRDVEFGRQVAEERDRIRATARQSLALLPRVELEKRGVERRKDMLGNQEFLATYEREMLFFALRDPENVRECFFDDVADMMREDDFVHTVCSLVLSSFISDVGEAKNSSGATASSQPQPLPAAPETSASSTPATPTE